MPTKTQIEEMFDAIAPDYDRMNHIMSFSIDRRWRRKAVQAIADSREPLRILDVAAGTGDFAIAIAKKVHPESEIIGIDLSEKMLEVGRTKVPGNVHLQQGDVEALPFPDDHFDRLSVAFGIRNFEHLEQGLAEMHRVLRPGGKMVRATRPTLSLTSSPGRRAQRSPRVKSPTAAGLHSLPMSRL